MNIHFQAKLSVSSFAEGRCTGILTVIPKAQFEYFWMQTQFFKMSTLCVTLSLSTAFVLNLSSHRLTVSAIAPVWCWFPEWRLWTSTVRRWSPHFLQNYSHHCHHHHHPPWSQDGLYTPYSEHPDSVPLPIADAPCYHLKLIWTPNKKGNYNQYYVCTRYQKAHSFLTKNSTENNEYFRQLADKYTVLKL